MKPQLLSTAALALLLTVGSAPAQTTKNEQRQVPQASTQNDSGSTGAARCVKSCTAKVYKQAKHDRTGVTAGANSRRSECRS